MKYQILTRRSALAKIYSASEIERAEGLLDFIENAQPGFIGQLRKELRSVALSLRGQSVDGVITQACLETLIDIKRHNRSNLRADEIATHIRTEAFRVAKEDRLLEVYIPHRDKQSFDEYLTAEVLNRIESYEKMVTTRLQKQLLRTIRRAHPPHGELGVEPEYILQSIISGLAEADCYDKCQDNVQTPEIFRTRLIAAVEQWAHHKNTGFALSS